MSKYQITIECDEDEEFCDRLERALNAVSSDADDPVEGDMVCFRQWETIKGRAFIVRDGYAWVKWNAGNQSLIALRELKVA
jgi:hypothetical protein